MCFEQILKGNLCACFCAFCSWLGKSCGRRLQRLLCRCKRRWRFWPSQSGHQPQFQSNRLLSLPPARQPLPMPATRRSIPTALPLEARLVTTGNVKVLCSALKLTMASHGPERLHNCYAAISVLRANLFYCDPDCQNQLADYRSSARRRGFWTLCFMGPRALPSPT